MNHHPAKAIAFWARKAALRKQPFRCSRCAKPIKAQHGTCQACRDWMRDYKLRKRPAVTVDAAALANIERRLGNVEHYFARLSEIARVAYRRGYCAGRRLHRAAQERASYFDALPQISRQELKTITARVA